MTNTAKPAKPDNYISETANTSISYIAGLSYSQREKALAYEGPEEGFAEYMKPDEIVPGSTTDENESEK